MTSEFADGADGPPKGASRREFLRLAAGAAALSGAQACTPPTEEIIPHVVPPEREVPGRPKFFATAMAWDGGAVGLLVESHSGRPIKVDGNPRHPAVPAAPAGNARGEAPANDAHAPTFGAADAFAQAEVLGLYDPARLQTPQRRGQLGTWDQFSAELRDHLARSGRNAGEGLFVLSEPVLSPTLSAQRSRLLAQLPGSRWCVWTPLHSDNELRGVEMAFGAPLTPCYETSEARVVLSLDSDFLAEGPGRLVNARGWASRRTHGGDRQAASPPNRMYAVETSLTLTGAAADHRLAVGPAEVVSFAAAVAKRLGLTLPEGWAATTQPASQAWLDAVVGDLDRARASGGALVVAGRWQPAEVHALAHRMNAQLGAIGTTVRYYPPVESHSPYAGQSFQELIDAAEAGDVRTLLILGGDPVTTAPAESDFERLLGGVEFAAHLTLFDSPTSRVCRWTLPATHLLESWSDARSATGVASIIQPLINPLYAGKGDHQVISLLTGQVAKPFDLVRAHWRAEFSAGASPAPDPAQAFESRWRQMLHDGVVDETGFRPAEVTVAKDLPQLLTAGRPRPAVESVGQQMPTLALRPDSSVWDGRFARNAWLQELPRPFTKLTWGNAALFSPASAGRFGVRQGDVVRIQTPRGEVTAPAMVVVGHPNATITLHLGYGVSGPDGRPVGVNVYPLRAGARTWFVPCNGVENTGRKRMLAITQAHHRMEGRHPVLTGTAKALESDPDSPPFMQAHHAPGDSETLYPSRPYDGYKWGMNVDLTACIGCNACVVACQAENNVPVVGERQVAMGREMHWIRVDQYAEGEGSAARLVHQPVMCQHCEYAPCEVVCPVGATTHSDGGLNEMTYNRCVGTRYCSNNCPYKVRRFNFLEFNEALEHDPVQQLRPNPDVTVRSRGVMEKCTYCVQRINAARITAEKEGRTIRDGDVVTACQAACPTAAITFGDLNDPEAIVSQAAERPISYGLLEHLNTRPRTSYLAAIQNPHPALMETSANAAHG